MSERLEEDKGGGGGILVPGGKVRAIAADSASDVAIDNIDADDDDDNDDVDEDGGDDGEEGVRDDIERFTASALSSDTAIEGFEPCAGLTPIMSSMRSAAAALLDKAEFSPGKDRGP